MSAPFVGDPATTTHPRLVLPFYLYAALAFLAATLLLLFMTPAFGAHYFHPQTLALTHILALGWGTMIILGASHQLVPVLIEGVLYSERLARWSFYLAAVGVPLLSYGFYTSNWGGITKWGGRFVILAVVCYLINLIKSMRQSKSKNIQAYFVLTATCWLLLTTLLGLVLVYNFTFPLLKADSLHYLPLHAHAGVIGWFLLLVIGVGSRLIPMFLISKYTNTVLLRWIFVLLNGGLILFYILFLLFPVRELFLLPALMALASVALFIYYCFRSWQERIRKQVDEPMQISLLSVCLLALPFFFLIWIIGLLLFTDSAPKEVVLAYGFVIFFGWLTAIILGMTFKTLPFIIWNKNYHALTGKMKTPNPKDLFSEPLFKAMAVAYLAGFISFVVGILAQWQWLLLPGALLLLLTAVLYNWNVLKLWFHKPAAL